MGFFVLPLHEIYDNEGKAMTTKTKGRGKGSGNTKPK